MAAFSAIAGGIGLASTLVSGGVSFGQAAKQRKLAKEASKASDKLMEEALRKAEVEFMQAMNIPFDAFDREERQNIQNQQQNIQALQEGDNRNLAAGVGIVGAGATKSAEDSRIAMGKELFDLQKMQIQEKSDINQDLKDMNVGAAADQQMRSRDAQEARAAAMTQGFASVGSAVTQLGGMAKLFPKSRADRRTQKIADSLDQSKISTTVVNQPGTTVEGKATYANFSSPTIPDPSDSTKTIPNPDYNMEKAALFAPTTSQPLGPEEIYRRLNDGRFKGKLKGYYDSENYDQTFYDILNR